MDKVPRKPKKNNKSTKEELLALDKTDLVHKILQLEAHNIQLRNIIAKNFVEPPSTNNIGKKPNKKFDFTKCSYRRVLLHILYFGWDYNGLTIQEDSAKTIEHYLFNALTTSCLIESRETSGYHRCGRTDKGVSSFGQVISISLRSKHPQDKLQSEESINSEIPYCKILNRLFPKEIRAVAWMPIPDDLPEYSARFDCKKRTYKYYFPRSNLNIPAMNDACSRLVGSHDFRHLCKMDVGNGVVEFIRNIMSAQVKAVDDSDKDKPTSMYYLEIAGNAFLWHQIRCIMGVLLLIGQNKESEAVIGDLLHVHKYTRKPQYSMASDIPLNLFECSYDLEKTRDWVYDKEELRLVIAHLQAEWTMHSVKTTMIHESIHKLTEEYSKLCKKTETGDTTNDESEGDVIMEHSDCLLQGIKAKVYTPLMKRQTCSSLEEKIIHYRKRRKVAGEVTEDAE